MGFVNEYVSDEDVEKFDLHGIWDQFHPLYKGELFLGNRPEWTIDRVANVFLISMAIGRGKHGNRRTFLLWVNGEQVTVDVDLAGGSSGDLDDDPFMRVWDLARIELPPRLEGKEEDIVGILKAGLETFGYWGIRDQRPNTVVKFNF